MMSQMSLGTSPEELKAISQRVLVQKCFEVGQFQLYFMPYALGEKSGPDPRVAQKIG